MFRFAQHDHIRTCQFSTFNFQLLIINWFSLARIGHVGDPKNQEREDDRHHYFKDQIQKIEERERLDHEKHDTMEEQHAQEELREYRESQTMVGGTAVLDIVLHDEHVQQRHTHPHGGAASQGM